METISAAALSSRRPAGLVAAVSQVDLAATISATVLAIIVDFTILEATTDLSVTTISGCSPRIPSMTGIAGRMDITDRGPRPTAGEFCE